MLWNREKEVDFVKRNEFHRAVYDLTSLMFEAWPC